MPNWNDSSTRLLIAQLLLLALFVTLFAMVLSLTLNRFGDIQLARTIQNEMDEIGGDSTSIRDEISKIEQKFAVESSKSILTLKNLNLLSSELGLTILRIIGPAETEVSTNATNTYQVDYRGNFENVLNFLARIESEFFCDIQQATLSASSQSSSSVELNLILEVGR